jgi:2-isopropylmalate synthase
LGYSLDNDGLYEVFGRFKELADKKKVITNADLIALMRDELYQPREIFALVDLQVACGTIDLPMASARLRGPDGELFTAAAIGTGPVDACFKAVDQVIGLPVNLIEYTVRSVTDGIDAIGEVAVRLEPLEADTRTSPQTGLQRVVQFSGHGAETDIVVASVKAYLSALNKALVGTGMYAEDSAETEKVAA